MKENQLLRQLGDIQNQGNKLVKGSPNMSDIVNFSKYSDELKKYLLEIDVDPLIKKMILEIPEVELEKVSPAFGIWALVPSIFSYWFIERSKINNAQSTISAVVGKYASIEFMLKGYFAD